MKEVLVSTFRGLRKMRQTPKGKAVKRQHERAHDGQFTVL
jgi:hypothetical protein